MDWAEGHSLATSEVVVGVQKKGDRRGGDV